MWKMLSVPVRSAAQGHAGFVTLGVCRYFADRYQIGLEVQGGARQAVEGDGPETGIISGLPSNSRRQSVAKDVFRGAVGATSEAKCAEGRPVREHNGLPCKRSTWARAARRVVQSWLDRRLDRGLDSRLDQGLDWGFRSAHLSVAPVSGWPKSLIRSWS